jgi:effector-binding domain-containing protein
VVRHAQVSVGDLPALFDEGYRMIATCGLPLAGPAFALYRGDPSQPFDLELGFPLAEPLTAPTTTSPVVEPSSLPGGRVLGLSHIGGYESLGDSWSRLAAAAATRGAPLSAYWEVYVTEPTPDVDPDTMRTDLFVPLPG